MAGDESEVNQVMSQLPSSASTIYVQLEYVAHWPTVMLSRHRFRCIGRYVPFQLERHGLNVGSAWHTRAVLPSSLAPRLTHIFRIATMLSHTVQLRPERIVTCHTTAIPLIGSCHTSPRAHPLTPNVWRPAGRMSHTGRSDAVVISVTRRRAIRSARNCTVCSRASLNGIMDHSESETFARYGKFIARIHFRTSTYQVAYLT